MNFLKVLGGIGLVIAGGAVLLFGGKNKEENIDNNSENEKSTDEIIADKYEKFSETDENPYNVKGCVVPNELLQSKGNKNYGETPNWVKKGKICAEASSRLSDAFFNVITMGYDYYGQYMNCTEPDSYYNDGYGYRPQRNDYGYSTAGTRVINHGYNQIIF